MVPSLRNAYNENFTRKKYEDFLNDLDSHYPGAREFRLAETPIFVPRDFTDKMTTACDAIIELLTDPQFLTATNNSIPKNDKVPGNYGNPQTLVFDFGVCETKDGELVPQLVEMQGFPSMYAFQMFYGAILKRHFDIPENYTPYPNNLNDASFTGLFKKIILGNHRPENVILLEIKPHEQKTRIDFYCTRTMTGIQPVCITELIKEGTQLFYLRDGKKTRVNRIYNRLIFDELHRRDDLKGAIDITEELDVEWVPHPDWFYRISKYTLPLISHPYVPETFFLHEIKQLPRDLENYVLKPLFSFAGQGVVIDLTITYIENIEDPENWILQKKVNYASIIKTPMGAAKTEIRMMYLWEEGKPRPVPAINLARISQGKMIGTRYNKDKEWVGGSIAFFEH
jgi:hypothetical protein